MPSNKEEVLQKFREWAGALKERAQENQCLPEDSVESLESLLQDLALDSEDLPELYAELKQADERVAEGSFYSPEDEVEFLIRNCLFYQLSQKFQDISEKDLQVFCFGEAQKVENKLSAENFDSILQFLIRELKVVDPSCGVGNFLVQYARIIVNWRYTRRPDVDLGEDIGALLIGGMSGVDSDLIAVVVTRVRLKVLFERILDLKSRNSWVELVKHLLNISIAWGNALGTESAQCILVSAHEWVKETDLEKDYLDLCKVAIKIVPKRTGSYKSHQISMEMEELGRKYTEFLQKIIPKEHLKANFGSPLFAWDVNFAHILQNGGFDIVFGNPPYIRQEDIATSQKDPDKPWRSRKTGQEGRRENKNFKSDLIAKLSTLAHLSSVALSSKADLSAYFFLLAKYLCCKGGTCGYITPNAWLDVQYGFELQEFLANSTVLLGLYERKFTRAFSSAAINTIITLFIPNPSKISSKTIRPVEFLSVGTDYNEYLHDRTMEQTTPQISLKFHETTIQSEPLPKKGYRREISPEALYSLGQDKQNGNYTGFKWGSLFFRAPDFFFELCNQLGTCLVPFLDVIDLNFGLKTGKNGFFVIPNKNVKLVWEDQSPFLDILEMQKVHVPADVLKPIIVSSRKLSTYYLDDRTCGKYLIHITNEIPPELAPYIKWGKQRRYHLAPSCQAHHPHWFNLPQQRSPDFIFFRFMDQRMWVPVNRGHLLFSDNFFVGYAKDPAYVKPCAAYFNSTLHLFFSEIWGRTGLGEGLLTFYGPDYRFLEILNPKGLSHAITSELDGLFLKLANQPVQPILEDLQNPARIALDSFIMDGIFNLPKSFKPKLYDSFRALVTQRLGRAKRK